MKNNNNELNFAVIAIEHAAKKMGISTTELSQRLAEQDLIEGRLWKYYEMLHTQSSDYVADDLIEALLAREQKSKEVGV